MSKVAHALWDFSRSRRSYRLTAVLQTLSLLALVLDRCLSLAEAQAAHGSSSTTFSLSSTLPGAGGGGKGARRGPRVRCASAAAWGLLGAAAPLALALCVPIASASVRMFPTRYACGLVRLHGDPPWLGAAVLTLGYLLPWAALVTCVSLAARRAALQRWRRRQLDIAAQQHGRGPGAAAAAAPWGGGGSSPGTGLTFNLVDTPLGHLNLDDYRALTLATVLVFMYLAMVVPGVLSTQVLQMMEARPRTAHGPDDLWPVITGTYETVLVWLRIQFAVVSPGVIVILSKDVRRRAVDVLRCLYQACCCCVCCCCSRRANAVGQSQPQRRYGQLAAPVTAPAPVPAAGAPARLGLAPRWPRLRHKNAVLLSESLETVVSAGTAVLFATGQGLHLRTLAPGPEEDADDVSTLVGGGSTGPPGSSLPLAPVGPWAGSPSPRYVFQFCDLAVIEDPPKHSPEASTAIATTGALVAPRRRVMLPDTDEREPSLTREELQVSLAKPRSLSNSFRKNVRFASVVAEIPLPLPSVAEAEAESGVWSDPTSSSTASSASTSASRAALSSPASSTDSPVRYVLSRPRTRSIELALVSGDLPSPPPHPGPGSLLGTTFSKAPPLSSATATLSKRKSRL
ncbi:uncharacterized protein LOC113204292 [Frankliniella occidentalis]|uniref:Uncharacterized protein LOC113204292 n=1 Tax=Frankliniella occidentalis TaxID=133901 RepID=A0A6J1S7I0_FRAOC|nr:uncharacterized protein LOC113204292 [Frankliniella occidentalis]